MTIRGTPIKYIFFLFGFFLSSSLSAQCLNTDKPSCEIYDSCFAKLCACDSSPQEYFHSYGKKYCEIFMEAPSLSEKGKIWRDSTLKCLQETILPTLPPFGKADSCNCEATQNIAFDSHVACYTQPTSSICDLSSDDIRIIAQSADLTDAYKNPKIANQIFQVFLVCYQKKTVLEQLDLLRAIVFNWDSTKIIYGIRSALSFSPTQSLVPKAIYRNTIGFNSADDRNAFIAITDATHPENNRFVSLQSGSEHATLVGLNYFGGGYGYVGKAYSHKEKPAVWDKDGTLLSSSIPGTAAAQIQSANGAGIYGGWAQKLGASGQFLKTAFIWRDGNHDGLITSDEVDFLGPQITDSSKSSEVTAVSKNGDAVGIIFDPKTHAVLWSDKKQTYLGDLGGLLTTPRAINTQGVVVGMADLKNDETHAFSWEKGQMTDLGTLGGKISFANAINQSNVIVGWSMTDKHEKRASIWVNKKIIDLNSFLPANSGWRLISAMDIDDSGNILGMGEFNGSTQPFVLYPLK